MASQAVSLTRSHNICVKLVLTDAATGFMNILEAINDIKNTLILLACKIQYDNYLTTFNFLVTGTPEAGTIFTR